MIAPGIRTILAVLITTTVALAGEHRVIDGDTIQIGNERIRLARIDTPETWRPHCARELELGLAAKARRQVLLDGGKVTYTPTGVDRVNRTLAFVFVDGKDAGEILIKENHAVRWVPGPIAKVARLARWCGS